MKCVTCSKETSNPKFCSRSCAATFNNTGRRRHGRGPNNCLHCGKLTGSSAQIYCSRECNAERLKKHATEEELKAKNAARQSKYRAKKYRVLDPTADKEKIKAFYMNRPPGYEVDHIIPLSKGGKHHEDNLQYLTMEENRKKNARLVW